MADHHRAAHPQRSPGRAVKLTVPMTDQPTASPGSGSLGQLQRDLTHFAALRNWGPYHTAEEVARALMVEAAELNRLYLWSGTDWPRPDDRQAQAQAEVADVLIFALLFCAVQGWDAEAVVRAKLAANERKYPVP